MPTLVQYPCSQFDYMTSGRTEEEAQALFEAWMAAHHPALLEMDTGLPRWETASYPPFNLDKDIVIVPPCCESMWSETWAEKTAECTVIRNIVRREEIVQQVLTARNCSAHSFDEEFVNDCYAFAAARFLVALLNRHLHYMQTPDEIRLTSFLKDAMQGIQNNQPDATKQAMQSAFDEIALSKDNYHPTQNYFIELTLATKTTVGEPLQQLLQEAAQINLFMSGDVLETLPETQPETFALLKSAIETNRIRFIVDDAASQSLTLLPILDVADSILAGLSLYRDLFNVSPTVYGRLALGLSPALPQLLKLTELKGAIHFAPLTGWRIKETEQSKIVWQGIDNSSTDALVRYPIDASTYLGFFEFADSLSTQVGQDSAPTSVFALFPGQKSGWLDILRRMSNFSAGLGKFAGIDEYFNDTMYSGGSQSFGYDVYPVNALMEPGENPISKWNDLYRQSTDRLTRSSLGTLLALLNRSVDDIPCAQQFVSMLSVESAVAGISSGNSVDTMKYIAVNLLSFPRRMYVDDTAVDVPPMGYAYVEPTAQVTDPPHVKKGLLKQFFAAKKEPVLARKAIDDLGRGEKRPVYILENMYFSAKFDAASGALRSIFTNRSRYNQLSRQIAVRNNQTYSDQVADEIAITKATTDVGQLKITGRLVFADGRTAARFTETVTIRSQDRKLEFNLTMNPFMEFDGDRWNSYIAIRYAWNDETFEMRGNLNDGMHVLPDKKHLHSPKIVDLRHEDGSLTFLSEGLPFHRRSGERQLDTLLIATGESQHQFRLGLAVNAKHPALLSYDFALGQEGFIFPVRGQPKNSSSWLFQIETANVVALHWEPILEADKPVGYMVYLQEVEGRRAHFALRSFLPPKHAVAMNFQGRELKTVKVNDDAVLIDMHAYELLPLKVRTTEPQP